MSLDAHYLNVFRAVLAECSTSQAANRLRTSPANVKRILRNLENELGTPLFRRETRGRCLPTDYADRLDREITGFLKEMEDLQQFIDQLREEGRVLVVGTARWIRRTAYFARFSEVLGHDTRFRAKYVEVPVNQERSVLESGLCDVYIGSPLPFNKRVADVSLPPIPFRVGSVFDGFEASRPADLKSLPWGVHVPGHRYRVREAIDALEKEGAGAGRVLTSEQYSEWARDPTRNDIQAMLSPADLPKEEEFPSPICWKAFPFLEPIKVKAAFLAQHPYGFLENAMQRAVTRMTDSYNQGFL